MYVKRRLMFENSKNSLINNKAKMRSQLRFKIDRHNVYTEEVNKIELNSNDNKKLQNVIELKYIHMEQMLLKCVKVKC